MSPDAVFYVAGSLGMIADHMHGRPVTPGYTERVAIMLRKIWGNMSDEDRRLATERIMSANLAGAELEPVDGGTY